MQVNLALLAPNNTKYILFWRFTGPVYTHAPSAVPSVALGYSNPAHPCIVYNVTIHSKPREATLCLAKNEFTPNWPSCGSTSVLTQESRLRGISLRRPTPPRGGTGTQSGTAKILAVAIKPLGRD